MNGQCIPRTPIVVDYWNLGKVPPRCLFFLTHMHADHTSGLSSSWPYPIHCTAVTGKLLVRKFKIDPKLLVELEAGESKMLHVDRRGSHVTITVTTIDANHCPGSAMFLFEGYFGRILYTGDFRFSPSMLEDPVLNGSKSIDVLYLDNTYCDPSCNFPTREEATRNLISLIEDKKDEYRVIIVGLHTLGKEDLLVQLATRLQQWVGVSNERMATLKLLELPDVFSTDMSNCFIQVHPFYLVAKNRVLEMSSEDALVVLPTCLYSGRGALPRPAGVVVVPYSDHCSFEELKSFVKAVRPRCIKPIVKSFSGDRSCISALRGDMSVFNEYLDPTPHHEYQMPSGTEDLANSQVSYPSPLSGPSSIPTIRRSSSGSSSTKVQLRSRSRGVRFLSPTKSKSPENLEIDSSSCSNGQNSSRLDSPVNTRRDTVSNEDNSTVSLSSLYSNIGKEQQVIDLTLTEQRQSVLSSSDKSSQGVSRNQPIHVPLSAQDEPVRDSAPSQLNIDRNGKSNTDSTRLYMFTQTKLDTSTKPTGSTLASNTSTIVRSKYFTEKKKSSAFALSLEEPVTCARAIPIESLKLRRNGHIKEGESRDDPIAMEDDKAVKDVEDSGGRTHKTEFVDRTATQVSLTSGSSQDHFTYAQRYEWFEDDENEISDGINDTRTGPSAVESMEMEVLASHLAEAPASRVEIIDLTHLKNSQSPPNSPQANTASSPPCDFQSGNSCFRSSENSIALTTNVDFHSERESNLRGADSANIRTPLPKLGASKSTNALYGIEPSQRSQTQNSASGSKRKELMLSFQKFNGPFDTPSSTASYQDDSKCLLSNSVQAPAAKRLKLSTEEDGDKTEIQTSASTVTKPRRILPAFLQPGSTSERDHLDNYNHYCNRYSRQQVEACGGACVCGCSETHRVPMCGQCRSSITQLNRSGLFRRLAKLDLNSPEICQVIHNAIDTVACSQQSSTSTSQKIPLLRCTCEDQGSTKCFSGLEEYISANHSRSNRNSTNFDSLIIDLDINYAS